MADGKRTGSEDALGWFILGGVILAVVLVLWFKFEYNFKDMMRWVRWSQMWLISWFVDDDYTVVWRGKEYLFDVWFEAIPNIANTRLDNSLMAVISALAMEPLRFLFTGILALGAIWAMFWGPGTQYRRKMTIDMLIRTQSRVFPIISPFITFNPSLQPPRPPGAPVPAELPPFAEALGPEEWLAHTENSLPDGKVDPEDAFASFAKQLGGPWRGPLKLSPYRQVLFAAFCLKASRKRKEGDDMLGRLAMCWRHPGGLKLDSKLLREARAVLRNRSLTETVLSRANQHAFENTAMMRALATAREEGGVLAPAQFVWLRAHDRELWYPLNNLGRQAYHMEALGALAHYKAERLTRRPIPNPKVQDAVESISKYMRSARARPVPQLDYSQSKKRRSIKKVKGS